MSFSPAATTLMACPPPLVTLEQRLGATLAGARRWQIRGSTLVLKGEAGDELAILEAIYLH
ncbi:MAG: hypothetical protein A3E25_17585 [Burkholderiales bacterium RIFCSPHIGHO2_12_FULL_69_20]|nr:MAG: hypothetical protein A3E25_17585 [Burkholderiales bacterium RIFCSPHIGHO2_12_FULL_69_20]